jgi:aspartokinase/homoserine dehydrogenase 1
MNFGELISSYLVNEKLKENKFNSTWNDSRGLIVTNYQYKNTQVNFTKSILNIKYFIIKENSTYIILPGFIASSSVTETSTLGRGGSDYSASILSACLKTELLEIWTDVSGVLTINPQIIYNYKTFPLENLSYGEAIELSNFGAKIIYPPTIIPSMINRIPILILNTFSPLEKGTLLFIFKKDKGIVTDIQNIVLLFRKIERCLEKQILSNYNIDKELCIITTIINDMKNIPVTLCNMFSILGNELINFNGFGYRYIKKNISSVIAKKYVKKYMNTLHDLFFKKNYKKIHIFIAGLGKVGSKIIEQLNKQKEYLLEELNLKIKVIAICNSKKMYFNIKGVNLNKWKSNLELGINMNVEKLIINLYNLKIHNKIFVDNTASKDIANIYDDILGKGIGIVTCNKISCASSFQEYKNIKNIARYNKVPFFFETNVGAGLPIISTLYYLIQSGDKISIIDAVLSGSLNFIFNKCKGTFIEIINEAKKKGFTEPDIRLDLSGIDVIRKTLILVRECGEYLELEDIKQISLLPKSCLKSTTVNSFYQELFSNEEIFKQFRIIAKEQKNAMRYIAKYKYGEASIELEYIESEHPFYYLDNKDNIVIYATEHYADQPLLIKGAGAGAEVTASGIFSDIIKASICI